MRKHRTSWEHRRAKSRAEGCQSRVKTNTDELGRLFEILASGEVPDFLEVMAGISAVTELVSSSEENATSCSCKDFLMSQKKCRFCS